MKVGGLTSEAGSKLNGLTGRVVGFSEEKERYDVKVLSVGEHEDKVISVREPNLHVLEFKY